MVKLPDQKGGTNVRSTEVPVWKRRSGGLFRMNYGARVAPDKSLLVFYPATSPLQICPSRFAAIFHSTRLNQIDVSWQTCVAARDVGSDCRRSRHCGRRRS